MYHTYHFINSTVSIERKKKKDKHIGKKLYDDDQIFEN